MFTDKNHTLFQIIPQDTIVDCVERAFQNLNNGNFGEWSFERMAPDTQVICTLFHQLIVNELSLLPGWSKGKQKKDADIVHTSGLQLQLKTKSDPEGIAGNRYSPESTYLNPSSFYLCVNFIPFESICKIRAGWVESDWWISQNGKGNAAVLKREKLQSLPLLKGDYLKKMSLIGINGIGEKSILKLKDVQIDSVSDLLESNKFEIAKTVLSKSQIKHVEKLLEFIEKRRA